MPTYTVTNSNFNLSSKQQQKLAEGITKVHNVVTGANNYFAQVIFNDTKKGNHFMGGKIVTKSEIFIYGHIRSGRTSKVKNKLINNNATLVSTEFYTIRGEEKITSIINAAKLKGLISKQSLIKVFELVHLRQIFQRLSNL